MWGLQILEKGVCTCVRSPPRPLHWRPAGISGCSPALSDSRWRQLKGWWGRKSRSQTTPDWWSLLEMKKKKNPKHLNQHSFGTLVRLCFYLDFLLITGTPCCDRLRWRASWFSQNPLEGSRERSPVAARGREAPRCRSGKTSTLRQSCTHTEKEWGFLATSFDALQHISLQIVTCRLDKRADFSVLTACFTHCRPCTAQICGRKHKVAVAYCTHPSWFEEQWRWYRAVITLKKQVRLLTKEKKCFDILIWILRTDNENLCHACNDNKLTADSIIIFNLGFGSGTAIMERFFTISPNRRP